VATLAEIPDAKWPLAARHGHVDFCLAEGEKAGKMKWRERRRS